MKILRIIFLLTIITDQIFTQEINSQISWQTIGNTFSQPNVHLQLGRNKLDWYGSGDVNNDEIIDIKDLNAIDAGEENDRGDIDGDGISSTNNDRTILHDYLNNNILFLPGHWNALTSEEEKTSWLEKMIQIEDVHKYNDSGWVSNNFIHQMEIDFYGVSNIDQFILEQIESVGLEYYGGDNARFNIPIQYFSVLDTLGAPSALSGTLVGSNPLNFDDWYFVGMNCEYNYSRVHPGDLDISGEDYFKLLKTAYIENPELPGEYRNIFIQELINFDTQNNIGHLRYHDEVFLILENPNLWEINIKNIPDMDINYTEELDTSPTVTGIPKALVSKSGIKASLQHEDGNKIILNSTYPNHDYYFNRTWISKASSNGVTRKASMVQKISIYDMENPYGFVPKTASLFKEDMDYNRGLSTEITGNMSIVGDNSNLPVSNRVRYELVNEDLNRIVYNAHHTLMDVFGNDTTYAPQIIYIQKPKIALEKLNDIVINVESEYQSLSAGSLEAEGFEAEPKVTTANTSSDYSIIYFDKETAITPTFPWANKDILRTFIGTLDNGEASDTIQYTIRVRDLERPTVSDIPEITISQSDTLHPSLTGYPEITDNVAIKDTVIKFEQYYKSETEIKYKAIAIVSDFFGNDTSYLYQNITVDLLTGSNDGISAKENSLSQNYPNPFNHSTVIDYTIISSCFVRLIVFDVLGNEEMELVNTQQSSGNYSVLVDASRLTSGTYFYRFKAGDYVRTKKMILVK